MFRRMPFIFVTVETLALMTNRDMGIEVMTGMVSASCQKNIACEECQSEFPGKRTA